MPYACRIEAPGLLNVWGVKNFMAAAACLPRRPGFHRLGAVCLSRTPEASPERAVHRALQHQHDPPLPHHDHERREDRVGGGRFRFYAEGMTDSVCAVMEAMDRSGWPWGRPWG